MKIIDMKVAAPFKKSIEGTLSYSGVAAGYKRVYNKPTHESDFMADSALFKGKTFREAVFAVFEHPDLVDSYAQILKSLGISRAMVAAADCESMGGRFLPNDKLAEAIEKHRTLFIPFAGADPFKGVRAVRELEHAFKDLGFYGVALPPWELNLPTNDKRFYPIFSKCAEHDKILFVHCSINHGVGRKIGLTHPSYLDEVAQDFPELKIVANHGGWPWVNDLVGVAWRNPNVYICISAIRPKYIGTPGTGWEPLLTYGNNILQDQVVWGSDWPNLPWKRSINEVMDLPLKEEVKEKWLYNNAARLLGLKE